MRTTSYFLSILLLSGMTLNTAAAQKKTLDLLPGTAISASSFVPEPSDKVAIPVDEKPVNTPLCIMNEKNNVIKLNYTLPTFTYSAILLIQDFTGRILKTFTVDIHNAVSNEFYINDLLSDTYHYTLVLDNQKKVTGEFIVKE
jgi:hypothetical protein